MANEIDREKKTQSKLIIENIDSLPILFHTLTIKDRNSLSRKTLSPNSNNKKYFYKPITTNFPIKEL